MYDAIIVGGRCAGAPLALLLARRGHKVLVVDRATFPSDTMSTHFIQSPGMARLHRWDLAEKVRATKCPPVERAVFHQPGVEPLEFPLPDRPAIAGLVAPRRYLLDEILINAAVDAGAELAEGVSVDSLLREDERVVGVRGHDVTGSFEARGRIVVGADGRHSVVARETAVESIAFHDPLSCGYYSYFHGVEMCNAVETVMYEDLFSVVFPTNDDLTLVAMGWPPPRFRDLKRDIDGNFRAGLARLGELGERILSGERIERYVGSADVPNFIRRAWGQGWALVGDALFHKDPVPADGITDAFRGADYLAHAIHAFLSGETDEGSALDDYERRHNAVALPQLEAAMRSASFELAPPQRIEAFFEIRIHNEMEVSELLQDTIRA